MEESITNKIEYASFWRRLGAIIIDCIIVVAISTTISFVFFNNHTDLFKPISGLIQTIVSWLYYTLQESSTAQATVGKKTFGIKVTDLNGNKISFGRANGRYFAKALSMIILYIGFLMIIWTKKKQGLHDKIAKTLVIKK